MCIFYHPGKANVVANDLTMLSMGSTIHVEEEKRELSLGDRLIESKEEGIVVTNGDESSLVSEVKKNTKTPFFLI